MSGGFDKGFSISPLAGGGGGGVSLNFAQTKGAQVTITAAEAKPATVVSTTITTQGNPVQIIVAGDANPSAGGWGRLNVYRDGIAVGQLVQFESSAANENVPYCLQVVDEPAAGTWTYSLKVTSVTADTQFGEGAGPIITVTELGAEAAGGGGVTAVTATSPLASSGGTTPVISLTAGTTSGDVLTWDGANWAGAAPSGGGTIAGTIAANEIAFGTGIDSIGGSAQLEWNAGTGVLTVSDAAVTPVLTVDTANAAVDLSVDELRLAGSPGAAGEVLTSNGPGVAPTWQAGGGGGGSIGGTIAVNEVAFGTGLDTISGSSSLTYNSATQDLTVGDGTPHSIRIGPYGYVSNPIIESLESMNINIVNFGGALGIQAANNDLVLIGGDDGGGQSYLQTQNNVRLESKGRLLVQPATDGSDAVEIKDSTGTYIVQVDSTTKTVTLTGDANPVLSLVDEISATPFLQVTPSTREVAITDPSIPTNTTVISTTDVAVSDGTGTGNVSALSIGVTDTASTNKITLSSPGGEATLKADDSAGALVELHLSASSITMQSMVASGDFFAVDASIQRLTVVDPGTGVDSAYLEGGRITVDAAGNTISLDALTSPTITAFNVGSSLPMPLNLAIEALQINSDPGSSGDVLVSAGAGSSPTWQAPTFGNFGSKVLLCVEGGSYATIQAAIDAAADWDIILVGPKAAGASWGPAVFSPGKRLVVASLGSKWSTQVRVDSITFNANSGLNILLNTVFVRGLFINSSFTAAAPGVNFYGSAPARLRLQECFIYNSNAATGTGVVSNNSGSGSSLYLDNSIVQSGASTGIGLDHQQGYTIIRNDSEISRYQYPLQCAAGTVEIIDSVLDGTGIANEVVRMTGGLVTCGYTTIKNTTTNATGANLVNAGAAFGMGDATFSIGTGTGYCVNGVAGSFYLYGNVTYSNTAAAAYNVKVKNTLTALAVTQAFTSSP